MRLIHSVFGFYLGDKISSLKDLLTWVYLLAGISLIAGLLVPSLSFAFYPAIIFLSWVLIRDKVSRSGMFFFWLPYCLIVGFGIWHHVFPNILGPVLGILIAFLLGNLFYLLLNKSSFPGGKVILIPAGFFLFDYLFHSVPGLYAVEMPLMLGFISNHILLLRIILLTGSAVGLFLILLLISSLSVMFLERSWKRPLLAVPVLVIVLVMAANFASGSGQGDDGITIAAVQGSTAMATHNLRGQEYLDNVFTTYSGLIREADADIFLFPEVPVAIYFPEQEQYDGSRLVELARDKDALLIPLVTEYRRGQGGQERYITALVVSPEGVIGQSSKRNLVPFSEAGTVTAGTDYVPVQTEFGKLGIAICYDFNDPGAIAALKENGAEIILAPFNDSSFGPVYHRIHSHYSILRALENNIPIVVANEDGISQIVDRNGNIVDSLGIGQKGVLTGTFELAPTIWYAKYSRYLEIILALGITVLLVYSGLQPGHRNSTKALDS